MGWGSTPSFSVPERGPLSGQGRRTLRSIVRRNVPPTADIRGSLVQSRWSPVFSRPASRSDVRVCVARSRRREVLLALGKGGSGVSKPKYTWKSQVRCRRK